MCVSAGQRAVQRSSSTCDSLGVTSRCSESESALNTTSQEVFPFSLLYTSPLCIRGISLLPSGAGPHVVGLCWPYYDRCSGENATYGVPLCRLLLSPTRPTLLRSSFPLLSAATMICKWSVATLNWPTCARSMSHSALVKRQCRTTPILSPSSLTLTQMESTKSWSLCPDVWITTGHSDLGNLLYRNLKAGGINIFVFDSSRLAASKISLCTGPSALRTEKTQGWGSIGWNVARQPHPDPSRIENGLATRPSVRPLLHPWTPNDTTPSFTRQFPIASIGLRFPSFMSVVYFPVSIFTLPLPFESFDPCQ